MLNMEITKKINIIDNRATALHFSDEELKKYKLKSHSIIYCEIDNKPLLLRVWKSMGEHIVFIPTQKSGVKEVKLSVIYNGVIYG